MQFDNIKVLSKRDEGTVYTASLGDSTVIIKTNQICSSCLDYEFIVGKELNKLGSPYLVQTIGYQLIAEIGVQGLVQEMASGETLYSFFRNHSLREISIILIQIIMALNTLQIYGFNHNDLHGENIIIESLEDSVIIDYNYSGTKFSIETNYFPRFIDYGSSRIKGIRNLIPEGTYIGVNLNAMLHGVDAAIFDPYYDIFTLIGHCLYIIPIASKNKVDLTDLKFQFDQFADQFDLIKVDLSNGDYPGRYVLPKRILDDLHMIPISIEFTPITYNRIEITSDELEELIVDEHADVVKKINKSRKSDKLKTLFEILEQYREGELINENEKKILNEFKLTNDRFFYPYITYLAKDHPKPLDISVIISRLIKELYKLMIK